MKREPRKIAVRDSAAPVPASVPDRNQIVDLDFLRGLIAAVDDSGIDSIEIARGGTRIRVSKSAAVSVAAAAPTAQPAAAANPVASPPASELAAPQAQSNLLEIRSPMVGTFYRAPSPEAPSYVEIGSKIIAGQTLCILEAMKLMNEMESEVQGIVREICVENAEPVEYGQVLFRVEPVS